MPTIAALELQATTQPRQELHFESLKVETIVAWNAVRTAAGDRPGYMICCLVKNPVREGS